jgi:hypothetical protein
MCGIKVTHVVASRALLVKSPHPLLPTFLAFVLLNYLCDTK